MYPNRNYIDEDFQKELAKKAEKKDHSKSRPRATKYQSDRFYNFPIKHKKRRWLYELFRNAKSCS